MGITKSIAFKILATAVLFGMVAAGIAFAVSRNAAVKHDSAKLQVIASYYPLYDFAKNVGGDLVEVRNMTPAGSEPHDYEPPARLLAEAQNAAVFIYNGGHMEPWTNGFLQDFTHVAVRASSNIDLLETADEEHANEMVKDPHFWLDPVLAEQIVANIRDGLTEADPMNAAVYAKNATDYIAKLTRLDADFRSGLSQCKIRTLISSHDAFSYLGKRYTLNIVSIAGISPEEDPSAGKLAELSRLVREKGIGYIFFESLTSPKLAETIASETGAKTLVFDPIEGLSDEDQKQGKEYLSVQYDNLENLKTALACR